MSLSEQIETTSQAINGAVTALRPIGVLTVSWTVVMCFALVGQESIVRYLWPDLRIVWMVLAGAWLLLMILQGAFTATGYMLAIRKNQKT